MGDFKSGLKHYEWRWKLNPLRKFSKPQWRGERLQGKQILLHAEQGLGDTPQFLRYVTMVQAVGGKLFSKFVNRSVGSRRNCLGSRVWRSVAISCRRSTCIAR